MNKPRGTLFTSSAMFAFEGFEDDEKPSAFDLGHGSSEGDELSVDEEEEDEEERRRRFGQSPRASVERSPARPIGMARPSSHRWSSSAGEGLSRVSQSCPVAPMIGSMPTPSIHLDGIPPLALPSSSLDEHSHSFTQTGKAISMLHEAAAASASDGESAGSEMLGSERGSEAIDIDRRGVNVNGAVRGGRLPPKASDHVYATSCPNYSVFSLDASRPGCVLVQLDAPSAPSIPHPRVLVTHIHQSPLLLLIPPRVCVSRRNRSMSKTIFELMAKPPTTPKSGKGGLAAAAGFKQ